MKRLMKDVIQIVMGIVERKKVILEKGIMDVILTVGNRMISAKLCVPHARERSSLTFKIGGNAVKMSNDLVVMPAPSSTLNVRRALTVRWME